MIVGAIAILFLMTLMFTNPHLKSQGLLFLWVLSVYILMVAAYSIINIPYGALTPELTKDYDERTTLNAFLKTYGATLKNKPFVLALVTYAMHMMGTNIVQAALLFYYKYILHDGGQDALAVVEFSTALMFFLVMALAFIPIWTLVSKRIGKKWAYNIGMSLFALALNGWVLDGFGYVPNVAQSPSSKLGIRLLVGPIAALFVVLGIVALSFYPITQKYYDERILPKVRERDAAS
jgi:Na+/melibiose symporter-like transporter